MDLQALLPRTLRARLADGPPPSRLELPGATLFADVSGFTPLTEALSRMGKTGAELLTRTLNGYFEPIIEEIHRRGGDVMRFAGDAVTVYFPGDDAEARAIATAFEIQRHMRAHPEVESPVGTFAIRIKIGISVGTQSLRVVGEEGKLEYAYAGEPVDGAAEAEHHAEAGDVVLHPSCAKAGGDFRKLPIPDEPDATPPEEPAPPAVDVERCRTLLHPALADKVQAGRAELLNEQRRATALFVSFAGGASDRKLDDFYRRARARVDAYDGCLNKIDMGDKGAKLVVTFGAPVSHEDDADRAVHLAEDLVAVGRELEVPVSIGIASGLIFAGLIGSDERCEYTVMGDQVNLAARLMQMAAAGQILVSQETRDAATSYAYQALPPTRVKGKSEPVAIFRPTEAGEGERTAAAFFVGREPELERAKAFLASAPSEPKLLWIEGAAGLGKTAFWRTVEKGLGPEVALVAASGQPFAARLPFHPWRRILKRVLARLAGEASPVDARRLLLADHYPEIAGFAGLLLDLLQLEHDLPAVEADAQTRKSVLERSVQILLSESARRTPLVVVLGDLQWVDPESRELLLSLLRRLETPAPTLVATSREPAAELADVIATEVVQLPPLSEDEIRTFVARHFGTERIPDKLVDEAVKASGGNPLLLEEALRAWLESGYVSRAEESPDILFLDETRKPAVAASLEEVVMARFDRLDPEAQALLKSLAVFGGSLDPPLVDALLVAGESSPETLDHLVRAHDFLVRRADGRLRFAEDHVRAAIEGSLDSVSYKAFHLRAARLLARFLPADDPEREARLANHYLEAAELAEGKEHLLAAARAAEAAFALPTALQFARPLLDQPDLLAPEQFADVAHLVADTLIKLGRFTDVQELLSEELIERAPDGDPRSRLYRVAGDAYRLTGSLDRAGEVTRSAETQASSDLESFLALSSQGVLLAQSNQLSAASTLFDRLERDFSGRVPEPDLMRNAATRGPLLYMGGKREQAFRLMSQAKNELLDRNEILPAIKLLHNLGFFYGMGGHHESSLQTYLESRSLQERYGISQFLATTTNEIGCESMLLGRWEDSAFHLRHALDLCRRFRDPIEVGVLTNLNEVFQYAGLYRESRAFLAEAARNPGAESAAHEILFYWVEFLASLPYPAALLRFVNRLHLVIETQGLGFLRYLYYSYLAHSLALNGNLRGARLLAEGSLSQARKAGLKKEIYLLLRALIAATEDRGKRHILIQQLLSAAKETQLRQYEMEAIVLAIEDNVTSELQERGDEILESTPFANLAWRFHATLASTARALGDRAAYCKRLAQANLLFDHVLTNLPSRRARNAFENQQAAHHLRSLQPDASTELPQVTLPTIFGTLATLPTSTDRPVTARIRRR